MTKITLACHHIVVAQAQFKSSPSQVYAIWTDSANRHRWEPTPEGMKTHYLNYDFRIGGVEQSEMRQGGAVVAKLITRFFDIVPDHRLVFSVMVLVDDVPVSCSQNTLELVPEGTGTKLTCHEMVVWLHGNDLSIEHQGGWDLMLNRMVTFVDR